MPRAMVFRNDKLIFCFSRSVILSLLCMSLSPNYFKTHFFWSGNGKHRCIRCLQCRWVTFFEVGRRVVFPDSTWRWWGERTIEWNIWIWRRHSLHGSWLIWKCPDQVWAMWFLEIDLLGCTNSFSLLKVENTKRRQMKAEPTEFKRGIQRGVKREMSSNMLEDVRSVLPIPSKWRTALRATVGLRALGRGLRFRKWRQLYLYHKSEYSEKAI